MSGSLETFNERIIGMMADNNISMSDALTWDFEGFEYDIPSLYKKGGEELVEAKFEIYLVRNGLSIKDGKFYLDIFMGRTEDLALKPLDGELDNG